MCSAICSFLDKLGEKVHSVLTFNDWGGLWAEWVKELQNTPPEQLIVQGVFVALLLALPISGFISDARANRS